MVLPNNKMKGPRICIVGASGFIGRNLVRYFADQSSLIAVRAVVRRASEDLFLGRTQVEVRFSNLEDQDALQEAVDSSDVVYHLASGTVPSTSNADPIYDINLNLLGSIRLLDACRKAGVGRIVFVSSGGTVYGPLQEIPAPETHPTFPICSYGIVKLAIERYLHLYHVLYGLDYTIIRASNPYGPFQSTNGSQGVVPVFIYKMMRRNPIEIWGDGSVVRDFIYIDDLLRALYSVATTPRGNCGIYNVGSGIGTSLNQLLETISEVSGLPNTCIYRPSRSCDVTHSVLNITKFQSEYGWIPQVNLEDGLRKAVNWFIQNQGS